MRLRGILQNSTLRLKTLDPRRYTARCGHKTKSVDRIYKFGESTILELPWIEGQINYCHSCIEGMTIRCHWCERPIWIGNYVTLYRLSSEQTIQNHTTVYNEEKRSVIGCDRNTCTDLPIVDRSGIWLPGKNNCGMVQRIPTLGELLAGTDDDTVFMASNE